MDFLSTHGWGLFSWDTPSTLVALCTGITTFVYLLYVLFSNREGLDRQRRMARTVLLILAVFSVAVLWPFRALVNLRPAVHHWDITHYYLGAKYFKEIGYDRLYDCLVVADAEAGVSSVVSGSVVRDLGNNVLRARSELTLERCKSGFSTARWSSFTTDVSFFRERVPQEHQRGRWARLKRDHGFTATPMWTSLARGFTHIGQASDAQLGLLISLDLILVVAMWVIVWRTFGAVPACVALIFWATNEPGRFGWTFLAFLRHAWLVTLVTGICMLKRNRHGVAGALMTASALLRIFPVLVILGLLVKEALNMAESRSLKISSSCRSFLSGAVVTLVLGLALSTLIAGKGWGSWPAYLDHATKYAGTTMSNSMGLKTLMYVTTPSRFDQLRETIAREELDGEARPLPMIKSARTWTGARARLFESRKPWYLLLVGLLWVLAIGSVRKQPVWLGAIVLTTCALITSELPSYYSTILFVLALLTTRIPLLGVPLLTFCAVSRLTPLIFDLESHASIFSSLLVLGLILLTIASVGKASNRVRSRAAMPAVE